MIKIKAFDLLTIAVAAEVWFRRNDDETHTFALELETATNLKKALCKIKWNYDTELIIDELPF